MSPVPREEGRRPLLAPSPGDIMGMPTIYLLLLSMLFVNSWILIEADNNFETYKSHVLHSRRMLLQDEQTNITETELLLPDGGDSANAVTTENKDKSETKTPEVISSEENGDEALKKQKKKKKKSETLPASSGESSNITLDADKFTEREAGGMGESQSTEDEVKESSAREAEGAEEFSQKETPQHDNLVKRNNETETKSDVELEVTASNLELEPEKKGEDEEGKKQSHFEAVLESEVVDPSVETQNGTRSTEKELGEGNVQKKKKKKKDKKVKEAKNITDIDAKSIFQEVAESNSTEAKELKLETKVQDQDSNATVEQDSNDKEAEKSTSNQDVLLNDTEDSQQEEFKIPKQEPDITIESTVPGNDDDDDDYGDFMQDFADVSSNFHDTALKVADHLGPNIQKLTDKSKTYFNKANQQIAESFSPLVGKQVAPFFGSLISYSLLLVPLAVVALMFDHIRAVLSLQKVLLFVNIYLSAYFATLLLATFIIGEPMTFFYKSTASGYIHLQLLQALGYTVYITLQTFDLASSCYSEQFLVKVTVVLQWFVAATIGFHYYVTVFHRAMLSKGPHTNWKIYGTYSLAFLVLCLFARIQRTKKAYSQVGSTDMDKKN